MELIGIGAGDLAEHLSVEGDVGELHAVHELGIGDAFQLAGGGDSADPQLAEVLLSFLAAVETIGIGSHDRLFGGLVESMSGSEISGSSLQDALPVGVSNCSTLDSHGSLSSLLADKLPDDLDLSGLQISRLAVVTDQLVGLVVGEVGGVLVPLLDFSAGGKTESLDGAALALHFRHAGFLLFS